MSSSDFIRWGGLASMLAGVAFLLDGLITTLFDPQFLLLTSILIILGLFLMVAGLVGFHALQKGDYGRIGQAGFYTTVVASLVGILGLVLVSLGSEALGGLIPLATLVQLVGLVLYGAATLQARVLPRWCGVGFIVALPLALILGIFGNVVFGLVWLALGYVLWSRRGVASGEPSRVG